MGLPKDRPSPGRPLILVHSAFRGWQPPRCRCPASCGLTTDRARLAEADAVVYHVPSFRERRPVLRRRGQRTVGWSMESEIFYPLMSDRAFMGQFDFTMTYRQDSTIWCPYFGPGTATALCRPRRAKTADVPVACFISNDRAAWPRTDYVRELMRHIGVACYGRVLRNRTLEEDIGWGTRIEVTSRHKFTLALENSFCPDYVTEKLYDPLVSGSLPVYLGAPNVEDFAPGDRCYVDASAFPGPRELARYLEHLDRDDEAYEAYFRWRSRDPRPAFLDKVRRLRLDPFCRLCLRLHRDRATGRDQAG